MPSVHATGLPLNCKHCGKPLTVWVADGGPKPLEASWTCPICYRANRADLDGRVLTVKPGHDG